MFITIEALRNSDAIQSRVTQVKNYLERTYGNGSWDPKALFPAAIVLISNDYADYSWVMDFIQPVTEPFGGVNPENYSKDEANYPVDPPVISSHADATEYVEFLMKRAKELNEPLLQAPATSSTEVKPVPKVKQTKAQFAAMKAAQPDVQEGDDENEAVKPANGRVLVIAPPKKLATSREFPQHLASMRTRAQLDNALQAFTENKMVTTLVPIEKAQATSLDIEVPKGKQAYVIVF